MAVQSRVRLYWSGNSQSYAIVSADDSDNIFVISGDRTREFLSGTPFTVSGTASNDGSYTSTGATYSIVTGKTTITVSNVAADQGASGNIVISKFVEWEFFEGLQVTFSNPAREEVDAYGVVHRMAPVDATKLKRFVTGVNLALEQAELTKRTTTGNTFYEDLYTLAVDGDTEFIVFHYEVGQRDGTEFTIKRYYLGQVRGLDGLQDMLSGLADAGTVNLALTISSDGTFSSFGDKTSITARARV